MGIVSVVLISTGLALRISDLPGAGVLFGVGTLIFVFGFSISNTLDKISLERKRIGQISQIVFSVSLILIVLSVAFSIMKWPIGRDMAFPAIIMFNIYLVFFTRHTEGRKLIMQKDRQLASILFTDIVGFTSMMGEDEDKTLLALDRNRFIQKKLIRKYRGKWVKEMGDGAIAIFFTASEAIQCAIDIQKEVKEEEEFKLSMGIHVSEILFTEKDIFGDGVNVASRIASLAGASEICFSNIVFQNIRNREDINVESLGTKHLKNVAYEVDVYKVVV